MNARTLTVGDKADYPLITSARKFFTNWENALTAAGIDYAKVARKKQDYTRKRTINHYESKEDVVAGIQKRQRNDLRLNARTMNHDPENRDSSLIRVARELFGTWDAALAAAGLDPSQIRHKHASKTKH